MHSIPSWLRTVAASLGLALAASVIPSAPTLAASPPQTSIVMSGTVADARAEHMSAGAVVLPAATPPVSGARIAVNGKLVAQTSKSGVFSFSYPDPSGQAVTLTVTAVGFGGYQLHNVGPAQSGDTLTVLLTGHPQAVDDTAAAPGTARSPQKTNAPAAGNCGGYSSNTTPPPTINVLVYAQHTPSGAPVPGTEVNVFNVQFQTYVDDVLPNEWESSWLPASLEAGAMAAKTYGWYWVNHWKSTTYVYKGTCYNVDDSINNQRYIPGKHASSTDAAITATWNTVMTKSGAIFQASFQATLTGNTSEACGSGLSRYPNTLSQWGSQNCAKAGETWQNILQTYYPGVSINGSQGGGPGPSTLTYTGATTADYHDAFTASATLTASGTPVTGATVSFSLGNGGPSQSCSTATNASGAANCQLTPGQSAGQATLTASYAGDSQTQPSHATAAFTITHEESTLTYTGPTHLANGVPTTLSGVLQEDGTAPVAGGSVTIAIGNGTTQQSCTDSTDSTGTVSCTIPVLNQPLDDTATLPVTATFTGDPNYQPSTSAATARLEYYTGHAFGLSAQVNLLLLSLGVPPTPDTGAIRTAQASSTTTPCTATANILLINAAALCANGTTTLTPGTATMTASLQQTTIGLPGLPLIGLSGVTSTSASTCTGAHGSATMALTIAGVPVTVPTAPNSVINLAGGAELIINEQLPTLGADYGLTVNAIHLIGLGGLANIVIASSTSAAHNCS